MLTSQPSTRCAKLPRSLGSHAQSHVAEERGGSAFSLFVTTASRFHPRPRSLLRPPQTGVPAMHLIVADSRFARLSHDVVAARPSSARAADSLGRPALDAACAPCRAEMERALLEKLLGTVLHAIVFRRPSAAGGATGADAEAEAGAGPEASNGGVLGALSAWAAKLTPADRELLSSDPAGFPEGSLAADFLWRLVAPDTQKRPADMAAAMRHSFFVASELCPPARDRRTSVGGTPSGAQATAANERRPPPLEIATPAAGGGMDDAASSSGSGAGGIREGGISGADAGKGAADTQGWGPQGLPSPQPRQPQPPTAPPPASPAPRAARSPTAPPAASPGSRVARGFWEDEENPPRSRLPPTPSGSVAAAAPLRSATGAPPTLFTSVASFRNYQSTVVAQASTPSQPPSAGRGLGLGLPPPASFDGSQRPRGGMVLPMLQEAEQEGSEGRASGSRRAEPSRCSEQQQPTDPPSARVAVVEEVQAQAHDRPVQLAELKAGSKPGGYGVPAPPARRGWDDEPRAPATPSEQPERRLSEGGGAPRAPPPPGFGYPCEPPSSAPGGARPGHPPSPRRTPQTEAAYRAAQLRRDWARRVEAAGGGSQPPTPRTSDGGGEGSNRPAPPPAW